MFFNASCVELLFVLPVKSNRSSIKLLFHSLSFFSPLFYIEQQSIDVMPFTRPSTRLLICYLILTLIFIGIILIVLSLSTTHWIHTSRTRAGFWKRCHLQPSVCYYAVVHSPAVLTIIALCLLVISFFSTLFFDLFKIHLSFDRRQLSLISVSCLSLAGLFLLLSYLIFMGLTGQFCYSFYLMMIGHWLIMNACIFSSYLQGRRHVPTTRSTRSTPFAIRRV